MFNLLILMATMLLPSNQPSSDTSLTAEKLTVERLPDMNLPRSGHCVFWAGGEMTVVGGRTSGFVLTPTAEYFADGAWHLVNTVYPHDDGLAVLLDSRRRVLIAGGHEKNLGIGQTYEAEMYLPETHTFEGFGCLDRNRACAQGAVLAGGEVLIAGNHLDNDALELFDGDKTFRFAKEVEVCRWMPYVLPMGEGDALVFGAVWRDGVYRPCDTVTRLRGTAFTVPLLKDWLPMVDDQNSHSVSSFKGDRAAGDYSYLVAAQNREGQVAFMHIRDTVFELLPTLCPVPTEWEWGSILFDRPLVVDRTAQRAYLVGNDSTHRIYVVAVDYSRIPAPITLYHSDPLPEFGQATPVLTPDGNLVVAGGIIDNNFTPLATAWLLKMSGDERGSLASSSFTRTTSPLERGRGVLLALFVIAPIVGIVLMARQVRKKHCLVQTPPCPPQGGMWVSPLS
ncbi:MAG: hypothetical protein IJ634_07525 [Bacteroidales bacterium]|nr:hypothetical protein [Bacteroidales bacterium]